MPGDDLRGRQFVAGAFEKDLSGDFQPVHDALEIPEVWGSRSGRCSGTRSGARWPSVLVGIGAPSTSSSTTGHAAAGSMIRGWV